YRRHSSIGGFRMRNPTAAPSFRSQTCLDARAQEPGAAIGCTGSVGLCLQDVKTDQFFRSHGVGSYGARMAEATKTDTLGANRWDLRDEVTHLRQWGTSTTYPLPPKHEAYTIGAGQDCWLRLWDPTGRISRTHALLTYASNGWSISDLHSKNGVHLDGIRL